MYRIIDKIRLKRGVSCDRFETWVRERDYPTCAALKSLVSFSVSRVSSDPDAPFHFFEVIHVDSQEAFEKDMASEAFRGLVADFEEMAEVVESFGGDGVAPGYRRS